MSFDKKYLKIEAELELRKEFQKDLAEKSMALDLLKVDFNSWLPRNLKKETQEKLINYYLGKFKRNKNKYWQKKNWLARPC